MQETYRRASRPESKIAGQEEQEQSQIQSEKYAEVSVEWNFLDRQFLEKTAALVDQRLADPLFDVEVLAAGLKISRRQLYRKLNALTGETPHDYITDRRLAKAAQLLLAGELTVAEVAYKTGFTDAANFSRSFTRHYGQSPSKYRKETR